MQVGGLFDNVRLAFTCAYTSTHLLQIISHKNDGVLSAPAHSTPGAAMAAKWRNRPVYAIAHREGTMCQRISSHPSMFLIFFLPVCTLSSFTCEESRSTAVEDVASLSYSSFISLLFPLPLSLPSLGLTDHLLSLSPSCFPSTLSPLCFSLQSRSHTLHSQILKYSSKK